MFWIGILPNLAVSGGITGGGVWFLFQFLLWPFFLFPPFIFIIVRKLLFIIGFLSEFKEKSKLKQCSFYAYVSSSILFVITMPSFIVNWNSFVAPFYAVIVSSALTTLFGAFLGSIENLKSQKKEKFSLASLKLHMSKKAFSLFLPVVLFAVTAGIVHWYEWHLYQVFELNVSRAIEENLIILGIEGQVVGAEIRWGSRRNVTLRTESVEVGFVVQNNDVQIGGEASLIRDGLDWTLRTNTLSDDYNLINSKLATAVMLAEDNVLLDLFLEEVLRSISANEMSHLFGQRPHTSINEMSHFKRISNRTFSSEFMELVNHNSQSSDLRTSAFDGYAALTISQLMENGQIMMFVIVDYLSGGTQDWIGRWDKFYTYLESIVEEIDFSNFPNGYYHVTVRGISSHGEETPVVKVENGEIIEWIAELESEQLTRIWMLQRE